MNRVVELPEWFLPFHDDAPYKCAYGGRSASKTYTVAQWFILKAINQFTRVACCRQFQKNIDESVKSTMEWAIRHLGVSNSFHITRNRIECPRTRSVFFFEGLERNIEGVRGWFDVTDVWVEEANLLKREHADILTKTVRRGAHATQLWFTFNPKYRTDWVYQRFVVKPRPTDVVRLVTWADNPWHTDQSEDERSYDKVENPTLYPHIWEGQPDDGDGDIKVLSYAILRDCVDAYRAGLHERADSSVVEAGLDVADGGTDFCATVVRRGPIIEAIDKWHAERPGYLTPTARRANDLAMEWGVRRLSYDSGGVGSPIREAFARLEEQHGRAYALNPENFGGSVKGKLRNFARGRTNEEMFAKRNAQLAWAVRLRAQRTVRLLAGDEDVDPNRCLFISDKIPRLDQYMAELSQPQWRDNAFTGKTEIDKRGDLEKSPDLYDATVLAFARDSESGLRAY